MTDDLPYGGSHAPLCPYRAGGECLCWRSDPDQNPDLEGEGEVLCQNCGFAGDDDEQIFTVGPTDRPNS